MLELLFKESKYSDAIKALILCNNTEKLIEYGDYFLSQNRFELAALCFIPSKNDVKLKNIGELLLREGVYEAALKVYETLNEETMVSFIRKNFK